MKYILVISFHLFMISEAFAQKSFSSNRYSEHEYLQKSRVNRNTGLILLSVGILTVGGGAIWMSSSDFVGSNWNNAPHITTSIGIGFTVASIPIFIISGNQGRRGVAASIQFSVQECNNKSAKQYIGSSYPAILMKYSF